MNVDQILLELDNLNNDLPPFCMSQFDYLNSYIYMSSVETKDLIYCNDAMKDLMNIDEYQGHKCWELIYRQEQPCKFCPLEELQQNGENTMMWTMQDVSTDRIFNNFNTLFPSRKGLLHMQCSFDSTKSERMRQENERRSYTLYNIAVNFVIRNEIDEIVNNVIKIFGNYISADHIRIYKEAQTKMIRHLLHAIFGRKIHLNLRRLNIVLPEVYEFPDRRQATYC
jgi:hypothetical protein